MNSNCRRRRFRPIFFVVTLLLFSLANPVFVRAEAMLELFQLTWPQITQKMPEIAEAGYDSLWLPNPAKGNSGTYSVGYDPFDPFDLGSTNQQGTIATRYGTQAQLIQMVQMAHRFGIRVYFDNIMNHRASTVPGYPGSGTPTNYYPGLIPQDFHLQTVSGGYKNWPDVSDWCNVQNVENQPLLGLVDLAQEPGSINWNFGYTNGDTITKPYFIRFPGRTDLYMDTNLPSLGGNWHGFDGHGQPTSEYVQDYLDRAVAWTLYVTKCDGFRLDAVKHVPADFFGAESGQTDDPSFSGYTGAIQAMYDYVHGYGSNVLDNGYIETDGNRNSLFNTESPRNDAMIFGEYEPSAMAASEDFYDYLQSGMRLLNFPLYSQMNSVFSGASMSGMDGRDYIPPGSNCDANGNFSAAQAVNLPQSQDGGSCCPANEAMENAYYFMHEGLPMVYSDGFNHNMDGGTPIVSYADYLGEFGDNSMPDMMHLHNQLSRGGTWPRWSDQNIVMFERYDYREGSSSQPQTRDVALFGMNDKTSYPGDSSFDDGITRTSDGYYLNPSNTTSTAVSNSRNLGIVVGFPPGSVLVQLASSSPTGGRAYQKLLVHGATSSLSAAQSSANVSDPTQRLIYVGGETIPSGGGAIELTIPSDSWVIYGYQWPEASRANVSTNAIILRQNGAEAPRITVYRTDGTNGDTSYNPIYPFKMRGSVDQYGAVIGGVNVSNLTYAIDVPIVTNADFDIIVRSDASCSNTLVKLDGGIDLNSQMGLGPTNFQTGVAPTNFLDLRDNPPGYADDVFLGYEQTAFQFRNGPEKFAARNILSNNLASSDAETYSYVVGGENTVVSGSGYGESITNQTAAWVWHDPTNIVTSTGSNPPSQRNPLSPTSNQSVALWTKAGYQFQVNTCYIYYTTDGSNPEGAFGVGKGTTQVTQAYWMNHDSIQNNLDWWKGTIPGLENGTQVRYKIGLFNGGSAGYASIDPVPDSEISGSKLYGLTQAAITNFDPTTATVWLHNDLNPANTVTGLQSGFHIIRARTFLPRAGQSSVYNTFLQTFYYDGALPTGVIAYPTNNSTIISATYTVVVRADSTTTGVDFNIQDSNSNNDDVVTGQANGNGNDLNNSPIFAAASAVTPDPSLSATYKNYPQEFRFVYTSVPNSGAATIQVRLKEYATSVYTNRYTMLATAVNTFAPLEVVEISSPATNDAVLTYSTNTTYVVQACFSPTLSSAATNFNVLINGALLSSSDYFIRPTNAFGPTICPNMKSLTYDWSNPPLGTNIIQVIYTNAIPPISDTRSLIVVPPLRISGLSNNHQLIVWDSAAGANYEVLATTNLTQPFQPVSGVIQATSSSTSFYDPDPEPQKFYEIQLMP
ncbi:MAG TPA: alpha-amylase family glycosyl hydrolase [Verrucomicrobiae bacterium]